METRVAMTVILVEPATKDAPVNRREGDRVDEDMIPARAADKVKDSNTARRRRKKTNASLDVGSAVDEAKARKRNLLDSGKHLAPLANANGLNPEVQVITSPQLTTRVNRKKK